MLLEWNPTGTYDLIVTHFFLDCFFPHQLEQLFDSVLPHVRPGAHWVISEFAIPRNRFAAYFARAIIGGLYRVFGSTTGLPVRALPDYAASLFRRGLATQPRPPLFWPGSASGPHPSGAPLSQHTPAKMN